MEFPERLLGAMQAGDEATGGDIRCDGETFGYLRIVAPTYDSVEGELILDLQVHLESTSDF